MKVKLQAGAEFDLLSPAEHREGLAEVLRGWQSEMARGARFRRLSLSGDVASDGTLTLGATDDGPADGFVWAITRLSVSGLGTGAPAVTTYANPAPGATWSATVPAGQTWRVRSVQLTLATSAAAGNRIPEVFADQGTGATLFFRTSSNAVVTPSGIRTFVFFGSAPGIGAGAYPAPWPSEGLYLRAGDRIRTNIASIDVADQLSEIAVVTETNAGQSLSAYANDAAPSSLLVSGIDGTSVLGDHAAVLQPGDRLVIAGTGLTAGNRVTVTAQVKEVPAPMAWSL